MTHFACDPPPISAPVTRKLTLSLYHHRPVSGLDLSITGTLSLYYHRPVSGLDLSITYSQSLLSQTCKRVRFVYSINNFLQGYGDVKAIKCMGVFL